MRPTEVVQQWLAAWAERDRERLGRLLPVTSIVHAFEPADLADEYAGFEEAERYFEERARRWPGFEWEAGKITEAGPFAVLPFRLRDGTGAQWWQLAVYRVEGDHIAEAWLHESMPSQQPSRRGSDESGEVA